MAIKQSPELIRQITQRGTYHAPQRTFALAHDEAPTPIPGWLIGAAAVGIVMLGAWLGS